MARPDTAVEENEFEHEIPFEAYGVRVALSTNDSNLLEPLRTVVPPGAQPCEASEVTRTFALKAGDHGTYTLIRNGDTLTQGIDLRFALTLLDSQLRLYVGVRAPDTVFVHAGAVAHRGRAIVMPGASFAGKTTLVAALVGAGATYYSDEFAVIDEEGLVHPYAKALSLRDGGVEQTHHPVESLGWTPGSEPLPVGMIAVTSYRPGAEWNPRRLSSGEGAMALLARAVPARERPAQVMRALSRATAGAIVLESERGDASELAPLLLGELEQAAV